jgi:carboxyl-terminal processing protease
MPLRNLAWLLIVPAIVALGLAVSYSAPAPDKDYQRVRQLVDVMAEVDTHFYRELSEKEKQKLTEDMINGGLRELDPHSQYFNAEQLKQFESESEGSYGGVGIVLILDPTTKALKADSLFPGTPAYEAGIIANDFIVKVDGHPTEGLTVADARKLIVGEPGTKVKLTIRRNGRNPADEEVELTRALIPQHPVSGVRRHPEDPNKWEWFVDKPNGIGYVRIATFNELTTRELKAAVGEIERDGGRALILDLRGNLGGLLNQAIDVSSLFLPEGKPIVGTRGRDLDKTRDFKVEKGREIFIPKPGEPRPIVVLIDGDSASASEIVSSALQDNGRAIIVGERSYGKGSVQKLLRLQVGNEKAAVKLTTETYWRPNGQNMDRRLASKEKPDEWGVKPDVEVPMTAMEKEWAVAEYFRSLWVAGKPSALGPNPPTPPIKPLGSLLLGLRSQMTSNPVPKVDNNGKPLEDKQLLRAMEVLKNKLRGVGEAPRPPATKLPERIAG